MITFGKEEDSPATEILSHFTLNDKMEYFKVLMLLCAVASIKLVVGGTDDCNCKPVDGGVTEWSQYSPCSTSCGTGKQMRVRYCSSPYQQYGGKPCTGDLSQTKPCNLKACPKDGGWSAWTDGECSKKCDGGTLTRTRICNNPSATLCGKKCEGQSQTTKDCNTHSCAHWGEWKCSKCVIHSGKCREQCTRSCMRGNEKVADDLCTTSNQGSTKFGDYCDPKKCNPIGACDNCHKRALEEAKTKNTAYWRKNWVGHACRDSEVEADLAEICKQKKGEKSKNGGLTADHWFWIHCSADGPWCKPCATRTLVFNQRCDACEATATGPCTGK